jgi:hypothetical protein
LFCDNMFSKKIVETFVVVVRTVDTYN